MPRPPLSTCLEKGSWITFRLCLLSQPWTDQLQYLQDWGGVGADKAQIVVVPCFRHLMALFAARLQTKGDDCICLCDNEFIPIPAILRPVCFSSWLRNNHLTEMKRLFLLLCALRLASQFSPSASFVWWPSSARPVSLGLCSIPFLPPYPSGIVRNQAEVMGFLILSVSCKNYVLFVLCLDYCSFHVVVCFLRVLHLRRRPALFIYMLHTYPSIKYECRNEIWIQIEV